MQLTPTDAELIRDMHGDIKVIKAETSEIKEHQKRTNGAVAELRTEQLKAEGALGVLKWLVGVTIAMVGVGAAVAGVVLAIVATRGA